MSMSPMRRLIRIVCTASILGAALACGQATAQIATGANNDGPIDITGDTADRYVDQHLVIYRGNVEAVQNGARLVCDVLNLYFATATPAPGQPGQPAQPAPKQAANPSTATAGDDFGQLDHAIADGHVFYVTQTQTARGEHAVYEATSDTITMTGHVVVVQGQNVLKGDKMVMELKSGHTQMFSDAVGRNKPDRVRGVFYNDKSSDAASSQGSPAAPAAPPAKR
jgi:lipopolysaccharide export system protein LptA